MKRMSGLTGKVAIVTGGNGGIGLGMARGVVVDARPDTGASMLPSLRQPRPPGSSGKRGIISG